MPPEAKIQMVRASRYLYYRGFCATQCKGDIAGCLHVKPIVGEDIRCADLAKSRSGRPRVPPSRPRARLNPRRTW